MMDPPPQGVVLLMTHPLEQTWLVNKRLWLAAVEYPIGVLLFDLVPPLITPMEVCTVFVYVLFIVLHVA